MNETIKKQIKSALEAYIEEHNLTQTEVAERSGVNPAYIINIRKGIFTIKSGDKQIPISDKYFNRLARYIGLSAEKAYWQTVPTDQMKGIIAALEDAKTNGEMAVITGETGCGKTYCVNLFARKNPTDVFIVTVGASDNLSDLVDKIIAATHIPTQPRSKSARIRAVAKHMRAMSEDGQEPMIIFDESEYMKQPALCAMKELYDNLNEWCALVLIGTDQLTSNIEKLKRKNKPGIPQLYRRIRYRIRPLPAVDRTFRLFTQDLDVGLRRWLQKNCDNYGELHDVLVPARRESERTGQPLTEDFVKMILGIAA